MTFKQMAVQEIIDELNKIEDKTINVYVYSEHGLSGGLSTNIFLDDDGELIINGL